MSLDTEVEITRLPDGALAPKFMAIAMNETDSWNENAEGYDRAIAISGGAIFGTHVYDARRVVNCCELTPSYELYRISTIRSIHVNSMDTSDEDLNWLYEWFSQADETQEVMYVHCGVIDRTPIEPFKHQLLEDYALRSPEEQVQTWEEAKEDTIDYEHSNPSIS